MNRPLKAVPEPVAPVAELSPLDRARARVADLKRQLDEVNAAVERAQTTAPVEAVATNAQSLRQRLNSIFAGMLTAGKLDTGTPEVATLTNQIASAENAERQSAAIKEARRRVIADLQEQTTDLRGQLAGAQRALDVAAVEALNVEIQDDIKVAYRAAAEQFFRGPHARLIAAGLLSNELCKDLREKYGLSVQPIGSPVAHPEIALAPIGFGFADGGGYNTLKIHIGAALGGAYGELRAKWAG